MMVLGADTLHLVPKVVDGLTHDEQELMEAVADGLEQLGYELVEEIVEGLPKSSFSWETIQLSPEVRLRASEQVLDTPFNIFIEIEVFQYQDEKPEAEVQLWVDMRLHSSVEYVYDDGWNEV